MIGVDHIMVESDYPHADSSWPDTQRVLAENWGSLPDDELRAVAGGNAARLFRHPLPPVDDWRTAGAVNDGDGAALPLPPRAGPVVDADGHVVEPESAWAALPERSGPTITADAHGYEHVVVGDTEILAVPLGNLARPGSTFDDPATFRPLADALGGGSGPGAAARRHGRRGHRPGRAVPDDRAVLLRRGGPGRRRVAWPRRTTTGWPATAPPTRAGSSVPPCCPLQDPAAAARELRRAVTELGFVAGFVRPNPCLGRSLSDRAYDAGVGRGRGARRADRDPRGQLGHRADARRRTARSTR